jgi:hypothetical protein
MLRKLLGMIEDQTVAVLNGEPCGVHGDWYVESVKKINDSDKYNVKTWFEQSDTPDEDIVMSREQALDIVLKAIGERVLEQLDWEKSNGRNKFESEY